MTVLHLIGQMASHLNFPYAQPASAPFTGDHSNEHLALEHHLTVCSQETQSETATILKVITIILFAIFNFSDRLTKIHLGNGNKLEA